MDLVNYLQNTFVSDHLASSFYSKHNSFLTVGKRQRKTLEHLKVINWSWHLDIEASPWISDCDVPQSRNDAPEANIQKVSEYFWFSCCIIDTFLFNGNLVLVRSECQSFIALLRGENVESSEERSWDFLAGFTSYLFTELHSLWGVICFERGFECQAEDHYLFNSFQADFEMIADDFSFPEELRIIAFPSLGKFTETTAWGLHLRWWWRNRARI